MNRQIRFLAVFIVLCLSLNIYAKGQSRPAPQFRTLFSNDLTNITTCGSPYSPAGTPFDKKGLNGSVDETVGIGIDVHMLQPGFGWVPLWKSNIYPFEEHARWYKQRYGLEPSCFGDYMLQGGDIVGDFLQRCREKGMTAFISMRMNDRHRMNIVDISKEEVEKIGVAPDCFQLRRNWGKNHTKELMAKYNEKIDRRLDLTGGKLYMEHPEYRLGDDFPIGTNNLWNWAIPEVRRHKLDFVTEICENYDIDGFELDFTRHRSLFRNDMPMHERREIMTSFVKRVRDVLDKTAKDGKYRWLSIRVPFRISELKNMGVDIKSMHDAGVDIFNLACDWTTQQQHDLAKIHATVPDAPLYIELTHAILTYRPGGEGSPRLTIMTTPEQLYTTAHLAYSRGAKGITAFNFVYYRQYGRKLTEPPFEVFEILRDPELVAQQPQHYCLSEKDYNSKRFSQTPGKDFDETFAMDMAPPKNGWLTDGTLRLLMEPAFGDGSRELPCEVYFNNVRLEETMDISEPYPTNLDEGLGDTDNLRAWVLPRSVVKNGVNEVRIKLPQGTKGASMVFLDVAIK